MCSVVVRCWVAGGWLPLIHQLPASGVVCRCCVGSCFALGRALFFAVRAEDLLARPAVFVCCLAAASCESFGLLPVAHVSLFGSFFEHMGIVLVLISVILLLFDVRSALDEQLIF